MGWNCPIFSIIAHLVKKVNSFNIFCLCLLQGWRKIIGKIFGKNACIFVCFVIFLLTFWAVWAVFWAFLGIFWLFLGIFWHEKSPAETREAQYHWVPAPLSALSLPKICYTNCYTNAFPFGMQAKPLSGPGTRVGGDVLQTWFLARIWGSVCAGCLRRIKL